MNLLKLQKLLKDCLYVINVKDTYKEKYVKEELEELLKQLEQQIDERCTIHLT